ncbi:Fpg/Nei family DNA glycosylase [Paeniglutamicibacter antarcticus]|uniref:Fpg/Nei family DNA glycosylase n=1 Tax=Arthrobacter terrae TaxID=2935737 RepID=A0A931CRG5_9MICC|nr:Fpg/Nei family DNA glycosylase [Arthrobacter terrae]MBG0738278.1 Fpg/Nei family DNA glycosylase [Arthrobacter terrae]
MPELPEIHALAADLDAHLTGRTVNRLDILAVAALKTYDPPISALAGQVVRAVTRRGKFLDISVGEIHLVMHLARAGWIRWRAGSPAPRGRGGRGPLAARLVLDDGAGIDITEAGTKKSLGIFVVGDPADVPGIARLGPDPLSVQFAKETFLGILAAAGRSQIKGVLRNQAIIAGIGNAYSDEILHAAKMSPFKPASMSVEEASRLFAAMQTTLRTAISRSNGLAAAELKREKKSAMQVHGRQGQACPVCGDTVLQVSFADSALQYCPTCQTGGKPLADRALSRLLK